MKMRPTDVLRATTGGSLVRLIPTALLGFVGTAGTMLALFVLPSPAISWLPAVVAGAVAGLVGRGRSGTLGVVIGAVLGIATAVGLYSPLAWYPDWLLAALALETRAGAVLVLSYLATRGVAAMIGRLRASSGPDGSPPGETAHSH